MKLINKFTLWYLVITLLVLVAGSIIVFYNIRQEIRKSERKRLESIIEDAAGKIKQQEALHLIQTDHLKIKELNFSAKKKRFSYTRYFDMAFRRSG